MIYVIDEKNIDKLKKDYKKGFTYKVLIEKYKITHNELISIIRKNKWKRKSNKHITHKGNKNAVGNKGGAAPKGNKNAVTTGAYENIFDTVLDEDERILMQEDFLDTRMAVQHELKVLSIREKRMLERIKILKSSNRDLTITKMTKNSENTATEAQNTLILIGKLEDALTKLQESKRRLLDLQYKIESKEGKYSNKGKSLADEIQEAYNKRVGDNNAK